MSLAEAFKSNSHRKEMLPEAVQLSVAMKGTDKFGAVQLASVPVYRQMVVSAHAITGASVSITLMICV